MIDIEQSLDGKAQPRQLVLCAEHRHHWSARDQLFQQLQANLPAHLSLSCANTRPEQEDLLLLLLTDQGLQLGESGRKAPNPIQVEFASGKAAHRRQFGGGKGQMIAKAVGLNAGITPSVVDATAGLGGDAFVLASLGCRMLLLERHPVVAALLQDGLLRGSADPETADICQRMQLVQGNSCLSLAQAVTEAEFHPQVVYLDPMFPSRGKSAQVKKEMRLFHHLVGMDTDDADLLAAALEVATHRVVVKRPRKAPAIQGPAPSYTLEGKSSRYDIYTKRKLSAD